MGLRDDIGTQVRSLRPVDLNEAQTDAMETEVWLKEKAGRGKPPMQPQQRVPFNGGDRRPDNRVDLRKPSRPVRHNTDHPVNHDRPLSERMKLNCNYCHKVGHTEDQCYQKANFRQGGNLKRPPQRVNRTQDDWEDETDDVYLQQLQEEHLIELQQSPPDYSPANGNWEEPQDQEDSSLTADPQ